MWLVTHLWPWFCHTRHAFGYLLYIAVYGTATPKLTTGYDAIHYLYSRILIYLSRFCHNSLHRLIWKLVFLEPALSQKLPTFLLFNNLPLLPISHHHHPVWECDYTIIIPLNTHQKISFLFPSTSTTTTTYIYYNELNTYLAFQVEISSCRKYNANPKQLPNPSDTVLQNH